MGGQARWGKTMRWQNSASLRWTGHLLSLGQQGQRSKVKELLRYMKTLVGLDQSLTGFTAQDELTRKMAL
jgi:hypothetical protein